MREHLSISDIPPRRLSRPVLLWMAVTLSSACGDGGTSGGGGSGTTTGTGGTTSTTSTSTAGTGGVGGGTGGTGGQSTGGVGGGGTGGVATGGQSTGGQSTGGGGMAGSGAGGSGMGGLGQGGEWMSPPLVTMPPLPSPPDYSNHPVDAQGRPIVMQGAGVNWVVPAVPDAISARELCADLVANCYEPGVRSLDACMMSAPHCTTSTPWTEPAPCCADACFTAYAALRTAKVDPLTAYLRVLYDTPICMPGVDAKLGGMP